MVVGARVTAKISQFRKRLPDKAAVTAAFQTVAGRDATPIGDFGLKMLAQGAEVFLSSISPRSPLDLPSVSPRSPLGLPSISP